MIVLDRVVSNQENRDPDDDHYNNLPIVNSEK